MSSKKEEAAAIWLDIQALKPWDKNPRINDSAVPGVMKSIERFGFSSPIIARKQDNEVIAGHTRLKAALELGLTKVPVRLLDLDPAEAHLLAVADNKLSERAVWDNEKLSDVLSEYDSNALEVTGYSDVELRKILNEEQPPLEKDEQRRKPTEVDVDEFEFEHTCPKCGFEF